MTMNPLTTTVLDLDAALGGNAGLLLGGGFGLWLKQQHLQDNDTKTLLPRSRWPIARTTQDVDLFLRAEVTANREEMARYRHALDTLGFLVDENAKWLKFERDIDHQRVILDFMVGPLGEYENRVHRHGVRIRPQGASIKLHARETKDALAIEEDPARIRIEGLTSADERHECEVLIASPFSMALMKLHALRDRINDGDKDEGRHHALDLYRIVAMLTEKEDQQAKAVAARYRGHEVIVSGERIIDELLAPADGLGHIRLREHPLCPRDADLEWFVSELRRLISGDDVRDSADHRGKRGSF